MKQLNFLSLLSAHGAAMATDQYTPDLTATAQVSKYLLDRDCPKAVKELNKALQVKSPEVLLMAGAMFEEGVCVKLNIDQATQYFMRADEAKHPRAMNRLIAMYARDGRDPASALWWANRSRQQVPLLCRSERAVDDKPDAFVAELNNWPKGQLAACTYTVGVYNRILGLIEFPRDAALKGIFGKVKMQFVPAEARVSWTRDEVGSVPVSGIVAAGETERYVFKSTVMKYLEGLGERSLMVFSFQ
jgi:hypothetical protein